MFLGRQLSYVVAIACGIAVYNGVGFAIRQMSFGTLAESVTLKIRKLLYAKILEKHMGWFDDREHATSVLTTCMAEETAKLNEASNSSLQPIVTGIFSLLFGVVIAFYYCWPMALGALILFPF